MFTWKIIVGLVPNYGIMWTESEKRGGRISIPCSKSNHLAIAMTKTTKQDKDDLIRRVFQVRKVEPYQYKELKKIHRVFGHPRPDKLEKIFKDAKIEDQKIQDDLKKIFDKCEICLKYQKKESRPKVSFSKATQVNQVVSIDLKPVSTLINDDKDKI